MLYPKSSYSDKVKISAVLKKKLLKKIRIILCEFRVTDKMIPGTYYKVFTKKLKTLYFDIANFPLGQIA